jgi:hypothetical protein
MSFYDPPLGAPRGKPIGSPLQKLQLSRAQRLTVYLWQSEAQAQKLAPIELDGFQVAAVIFSPAYLLQWAVAIKVRQSQG